MKHYVLGIIFIVSLLLTLYGWIKSNVLAKKCGYGGISFVIIFSILSAISDFIYYLDF